MLWEKVDKFGVTIETARGPLAFPWHGDKFLMLVLMERGYSREIVRRLNRVRIHMQVLFLSDILIVSGNRIYAKAHQLRPATNRQSMLNWPKEAPTTADMMLWKEALEDICPSRRCLNCLGQYVAKSHQVREWRWCALLNKLLRYYQDAASMDVYKNTTKKLNKYMKSFPTPRVVRGNICSVDEIQPGVFRITSTAQEAQDPAKPTTFVEVLREWGCSWLWEYMPVKGETDWIAQAITARSLVAITDRLLNLCTIFVVDVKVV